MTTPFYQPLDPQPAPDPVTPADTPGDASGYASVTPHGQGPAPYDIQAPLDEAAITAAYNSALAVAGGQEGASSGAGLPDRMGPRQSEAAALLNSPQGSPAMDVTAGWSGGGGDGWPANPQPIPTAETPIQGSGDFTGTGTD